MSTKILIGGISEKDMDLFLLEECVSSPNFLSWLIAQVPDWPINSNKLLTASRSVDPGNGESDLELTVCDSAGRIGKILVENKLRAGFQPQQLLRYRDRASMYVQRGDCAHCAVILFAPKAYATGAMLSVDAVISYEAVEDWLKAAQAGERVEYKLRLVQTALEKHHLGYNPITDEPVTTFWSLYWHEANRIAPELQFEEPGAKPAGAGFVWFYPTGLPGQINICHKLPKGYVDLQFPGWGLRTAELKAIVEPFLDPDMRLAQANKSAAVRLTVPCLNTGLGFAGQGDAVRSGLLAAKRLYDWCGQNRSRIVEILATGDE